MRKTNTNDMASNQESGADAAADADAEVVAKNLISALRDDDAGAVLQHLVSFGTNFRNTDLLHPFRVIDDYKDDDSEAYLMRLPRVLENIVRTYAHDGSNQHELMLRVLLTHHEANVHTLTLAMTAEFGCVNTATKLMSHETLSSQLDPGWDQQFALRRASCHGYVDIVKLLLCDSRVDPSALNNAALAAACENGHEAVVKLLLADPRVDVTANSNFAFRVACRTGQLEIVRLLLADHRVAPASVDDYAVRVACSRGHEAVVKLLLSDDRVDPLTGNGDALYSASFNGHLGVVKLLLADDRFDSAAPGSANNVLLAAATYCAAAHGHAELLEWLMSRAAPPAAACTSNAHQGEAADAIALQPLAARDVRQLGVSAVESTHCPLNWVELLSCKKDYDSLLEMAFQVACERGHADVVKLLVHTAKSAACQTGAIAAVRFGHGAVLEAILPQLDDRAVVSCFKIELARFDPRSQPKHSFMFVQPAKLLMTRGEVLKRVCWGTSLWETPRDPVVHNKHDDPAAGLASNVVHQMEQALSRLLELDNSRGTVNKRPGLSKAIHQMEDEAMLLLLLCVKRRFSNTVAARVGDVLREVCAHWTRVHW